MAERSQLNVRIDKATSDRLSALARRLSLSQGAVVRLAVARMAQGEGLRDTEVVVWMGDFNYRIDCDYDTVVDKVRRFAAGDHSQLTALLEKARPLLEALHVRCFCNCAP